MSKPEITAVSNKESDIQGKGLLFHFEQVASKMKRRKFSSSSIESARENINYIQKLTGLTENQIILLAIIISLTFEKGEADYYEISKYLDCTGLKVFAMKEDIDHLVNVGTISKTTKRKKRSKTDSFDNIEFYVNKSVLESILNNKLKQSTNCDKYQDIFEFLQEVNNICDDIGFDQIPLDEVMREILQIIDENQHLVFCKEIKKIDFADYEILILILITYETFCGNESSDFDDILDRFCDENFQFKFKLRKKLLNNQLKIISENYIELEPTFFRSDSNVRLSDKAIETLLFDNAELIDIKVSKKSKNIINANNIIFKQLYYNMDEESSLKLLSKSLENDNYTNLLVRLREKGLPENLTVLMYGAPGTGKTETAMQLALHSKRNIFIVDISSTKSMWFGESEKLIKKVFDTYKNMVEKEPVTPILLFNEADAIFSKRKEIGSSTVAQTENAIQNIILQEMENLKGILIATTNLTQNLDNAFERRFLYKIKFSKPSFENRLHIWNSKIPEISMEIINNLSANFDLTGGQIDNIVRKYTTQQLLFDEEPTIEDLKRFCMEEAIQGLGRKIGYKN